MWVVRLWAPNYPKHVLVSPSRASVLFLQTLPHSWYLQFSSAAHHEHVQTITGGPVVGRLLVGGDDAHVALPPVVSTVLLVEMVSMEKP